jgi:hypothetical protein
MSQDPTPQTLKCKLRHYLLSLTGLFSRPFGIQSL